MKKIRIGVIGLGGIFNAIHSVGIIKSPDLELVALCDTDEEKLRQTAKKFNIDESRCFINYEDLISCDDVDAVDICTPNDAHFSIAMAAAEAKKPFALEKPITLNKNEADLLYDLTIKNDVKNMICFSYRFKAAARYAKDLIASGFLGDIYHINSQYFQSWAMPNNEVPLIWRLEKAKTGSGALGDLGCHALDLVRFITDKEYLSVVSQTGTIIKKRKFLDGSGEGDVDVDDFCNYMAEMEGSTSATFSITRFAFGRGNYQRLEVYGSKGALVYKLDDNDSGLDTIEVCEGSIAAKSHVFTQINIPAEYNTEQMQCFADILNNCSDELPANVYDGMRNQHVVDAVLQSAEEKRWVNL